MTDVLQRELGEIKGLLTGIRERQDSHDEKLDKLDDRLRTVEKGAAVAGAVTGGIMAIAIGFIKQGLKIGS